MIKKVVAMETQPLHPNVDPSDAESVSPNVPFVYEEEQGYHWQYKCIRRDLNKESPLEENALNEVGQEGWELVSVVTHNSTAIYHFKRLAVQKDKPNSTGF